MSDENNNEETSNKVEIDAKEYKTLQDSVSSMKNEMAALLEHKNTILDEKKKEQEKRRTIEDEAAKKNGNFEQLLASSESSRKELEERFNTVMVAQSKDKIQSAALKLAASDGMAEGANVELLSEFISRRLTLTEDGLKVMDKDGQLTVSTLDDLKKEFANDVKYASLITRTKANGGGATGSKNDTSSNKIERTDFAKMNPAQKMEVQRRVNKGEVKIID